MTSQSKLYLPYLGFIFPRSRLIAGICVLFDSRDERRWIEKQNRAMRQKRKKEEGTRMRNLVGEKLNPRKTSRLENGSVKCKVDL